MHTTHNIASAVAKLVSSNLIIQLLPFILLPFIYQLYDKEHIGNFSIIMSIFSLCAITIGGKLESSILIIKSDKLRDVLVQKIIIIYIVSSVFGALLIVWFAGNIIQEKIIFYFIVFTWLFFHISNLLLYQKMVSSENYNRFALQKLIFVSLLMFSQLTLGYFHDAVLSLCAAYSLANFLIFVINIPILKSEKQTKHQFQRLLVHKRILNFPRYSMPQSLFNAFANDVPIYIIIIYASASVLADYHLAVQIVTIPLGLLSTACSQVLYQKLSINSRDAVQFRFIFRTFAYVSFFAAAISIVCYNTLATPLIEWAFGDSWASAIPVIGLISIMASVRAVGSILSVIVWVLNKQKVSFLIEIVSFPLRLGGLLMLSSSDTLYDMLIGYVVVSTGVTILKILWYLRLEKNYA